MKTRLFLMSILTPILFFSSCHISNSKTEDSPYVPAHYQASFQDDFDVLSLDTAGNGSQTWATWWVGWEARYLQGNNEKAWKCDRSYKGKGDEALGITMHEVTKDKTLKLYGKQTPQEKRSIVSDMPFLGGMISSQLSHTQLYGYFEIKARFDISKGHHWAIWMIPADNSWPPEIDILEVVGHQPRLAFMNGHWKNEGTHKSEMTTIEEFNSKAFHTYGFKWTSDSLYWYIDGNKKKQMANYINTPMYLLISPEIGGDWPGMPDTTTKWPTFCEIDYIRMYEKQL